MRSRSVARGLAVLAIASAASWLGCGGSGSDITGPAVGSLDVTTATSGPEPDPDGYTVSIDGAAPQSIGDNATQHTAGLAAGQHTVELDGVAGNCTVAAGTSMTVAISTGGSTAARFEVTCAPTMGTVEVVTTSSGGPPDPDGYQLQLDGAPAQPIGTSDTVSIPGVAPGTHTVALGDLATNCAVDGDNPQSVAVAVGATAHVAIAVTCTTPPPPPAPGSISVTTRTSGPDPDPDGYAVTVDGAGALAIDASGTLPLPDLTPGPHAVGLAGLSGNCRLEGDNPRSVTVSAGTVASVVFTITCTALPPSTGTIAIGTATSGPNQDPDGYAFTIDQGDAQPIGVNGTASVAGLTAGSHSVRLNGVSANCAVTGDNPRTASVVAGGTAQVTFSVTCTPATGALTVTTTTTGAPADPDGYTFSIDNAAPSAVGTSASVTVQGLPPGAHSVLLGGLAGNCKAQVNNPQTVTVAAGETVVATFAVTCSATTGALAITVTGLPAGTNAAVTVTGPNGFNRPVTATATLADLAPGSYSVTAANVASGGTQYTASPPSSVVPVAAGDTAGTTVTYSAAAGPSVNLRIDGLFLTQSVQSAAGDVPLVANREGFLRVFVVADQPNTVAPHVRVRLYRDGTLARTFDVPAPGPSTPLSRDEATLESSWNLIIPRDLFGPGLAVLADVDPANAIAEKNESDNSYPASGAPAPETVRNVPALGVRFVPVRQQTSGLTGDVSDANRSTFLDLARRIYPISTAAGDLHQVYTTTTAEPLVPDDANGAWTTILGEVDALRVVEGTTRNYYGVVQIGYGSGIAGLGYIGVPTAIGYDRAEDRSRVMAHELGHNFNRLHAPCGQPPGVDPNYPYSGGLTGVYGYDLQDDVLKSPLLADIMGYCVNPWISDYTYDAVLAFRTGAAAASAATAALGPQRCLLVWGRIVNGRAVLEPTFEVVTQPSLPKAGGPYVVDAVGYNGSRVFSLSFNANQIEDGRGDVRQFAFAVPLGQIVGDQIGSLRLAGPGGAVAAARAPAPPVARAVLPAVEARRMGGVVAIRWDSAANPMAMVRDPNTGEVVSFARGGTANIVTAKRTLDVTLSDGVGSRGYRVTVGP